MQEARRCNCESNLLYRSNRPRELFGYFQPNQLPFVISNAEITFHSQDSTGHPLRSGTNTGDSCDPLLGTCFGRAGGLGDLPTPTILGSSFCSQTRRRPIRRPASSTQPMSPLRSSSLPSGDPAHSVRVRCLLPLGRLRGKRISGIPQTKHSLPGRVAGAMESQQ